MTRWFSVVALLLLVALAACQQKQDAVTAGLPAACTSRAVETDGHRRLALIVGVNDYANPDVPDLAGPERDAQAIASLLSGANGFGFPQRNTCVLLGAQAKRNAFIAAFQNALIDRAESGDSVVIYFAGHGSQIEDLNGDESDEQDETLLFQDARTANERDLLDDELNQLLAQLAAKTSNVTVILDSCNSGTATRGASTGAVARFATPDANTQAYADVPAPPSGEWRPDALRNVVVFAAAGDGTAALERGGSGIFTSALITVAADAAARTLTFGQLERRVRPLVAAASPQVPYVDGNLDRVVFDTALRPRPLSLVVDAVNGAAIDLSGPPLPGLGVGAELRIYDARASFVQMIDPAQMKALVRIESVGARLRATSIAATAARIEPGDIAVLARAAPNAVKLGIRFVSVDSARDPLQTLRTAVQAQLSEAEEAQSVEERAGDFAVFLAGDGVATIVGPDGQARASIDPGADQAGLVARRLIGFARARAILALRGEGGAALADGESVKLTAEPVSGAANCTASSWRQAGEGSTQIIPLCQAWQLRVSAGPSLRERMRVAIIVLSSDGAVDVVGEARGTALGPGDNFVVPIEFTGAPPVDTNDYFVAFATSETVQNDYSILTWHPEEESSVRRGAPAGALARALNRYVNSTRSADISTGPQNFAGTAWAMSVLTTRVDANPRYAEASAGTQTREYSIADFDIRPYLPGDQRSALYRLLQVADGLARSSTTDGYPYKQHAWSAPTEAENLRQGIDCSRVIWHAFKQAGIPYNNGDAYLTTAQMAEPQSRMREQFDSCSASSLQVGDILVYLSTERGDGHVVMVIDPERRIAWGSHGWDGNPVPDRGVEYQRIRNRSQWDNWDRSNMRLVGCWRNRALSAQMASPAGQPGMMTRIRLPCRDQCTRP